MAIPTRFPIRFKILVAVLFVITAVVGIITFTMANLFHADKKTYIHDLVSVVALNTAEESRSLLSGYRERLQVYARLMNDRTLSQEQKSELLKGLSTDFRDFLVVAIYENGKEQAEIYDVKALTAAGLTKKEVQDYRKNHPPPFDLIQAEGVSIERSPMSEKVPAFTMAIAYQTENGSAKRVLSAILRLDSLLRITGRSRLFETFLVDDRGVLLAHSDPKQVVDGTSAGWIPKAGVLQSRKSAVNTVEYDSEGKTMIGGFARAEFGSVMAGARIPKTVAYIASRSLLNNLVYVSLGLLLASALLSLDWSRRITRPIMRLYDATKEVEKGKFDIQVTPTSRDEIGDLAFSFNQMAAGLTSREEALQRAQAQLIQSEKMAAFGQLGAGIAHEVKNPLAGILGYVQLSLRKVEGDSPVHGNLKIIEKEAKRCKTIIDNLLKFARQEKVSFEPMDINRVVEDTAALMDHQLGMHQIRLEKELAPDLPPVIGNANQIQQVLMNLMINAEQAMEGNPGRIRLSTLRSSSGRIEIRVSDTGPGIPAEIQKKLFEPFFTTKPAGKGTGLGLSVTYGIIKQHKGDIRVESETGRGTMFIIEFPVPDIAGTTAPQVALT